MSSSSVGSSLRGGHSSHLHKRVGKYLLGRTIGEGTYAKVKYGQHADTGEAVAIKVLDKEQLVRSGMVEQIKREITILKQIRHPNIVNLHEVMSSREKIFMVMELVTGGELFDKVVAEGPMKEPAARRVFSQLLDAVGYCHSQGVYHRDLKPENVLLGSDGAVKLSDFGLGVLPNPGGAGTDGLLRTTCGTPNYVAPEVLAKKGYRGGPADVWSLGVVLYVILAGCLPFDEDDLVTLFQKISAAQYEVPPWLSDDAVGLLSIMLNPAPEERPAVEQLWAHPWMRSGLARRSMFAMPAAHAATPAGANPSSPQAQEQPQDIFAENVKPELIKNAYKNASSRRQQELTPRTLRKLNAFELINSGLDISAIFEARDDVVTRHTRFSTRAKLDTIAAAIENAAVAVGGRVERRDEGRLRLYIPNPKGMMHVLVEMFEVLPGTHMVDLQKVKGNTVEFHSWYADLTAVLSSIISKKQPGPAGDLGARAAAARRREAAGGQMRKNAFELVASAFNIGAIFEENEGSTSRHVQFSSRLPAPDILTALEQAAAGMGGTFVRSGEKRTSLRMSVAGGRVMKLQAHLFEVLPGIQVCQIDKDAGSSLDFMRCYSQLASRLQPIMMKSRAFPTASKASALLVKTKSMSEAEQQAIEDLPPPSPSCSELSVNGITPRPQLERVSGGSADQSTNGGDASAGGSVSGGSPKLNLPVPLPTWVRGPSSASRGSLCSVPEEPEASQGQLRQQPGSSCGGSSSSSTPAGGSPPSGSSPRATWSLPLPTVVETVTPRNVGTNGGKSGSAANALPGHQALGGGS